MRTGSERAFTDLHRRHSGYLFGMALRLHGYRQADAEEAYQEAWVRAVQRLPEFQWRSSLRTWLGGFVVHCSRELWRRRTRPVPAEEPPGSSKLPGLRVDLERALAALPAEKRAVLVLFDVEGYGHDEISELLQIPVGTSKSRLSEARATLRRRLSRFDPKSGGLS